MSDQQPPFPPGPPAPPPPPPGPFSVPPAAAPPPPPSSPGDRRRWKTWQLAASAGVSLLLGIGIGAASSGEDPDETVASGDTARTTVDRSGDADDEPAQTTEPRRTTTTRPATTTTTLPDEGTRENPFALGTPLVSDSGVEVTVNSVDFDAAAAIAAENMFNDPAPAGMRYALVNLTITNTSDEPIDTGFEISVSMIGSANRLYDFSNGYCSAVIPNSLNDGGQLFTGGTFTGNECLVVPEAEVADGSLLVGIAAGFGDPVFVRSS